MPSELVRENPSPYLDGSAIGSKKKKKTKLLFSGNEAWHGQRRVAVVAGQPTDQWAVQEGQPQQAKIS